MSRAGPNRQAGHGEGKKRTPEILLSGFCFVGPDVYLPVSYRTPRCLFVDLSRAEAPDSLVPLWAALDRHIRYGPSFLRNYHSDSMVSKLGAIAIEEPI